MLKTIALFAALLLLAPAALADEWSKPDRLAGRWYPGAAKMLSQTIEPWLATKAAAGIKGKVAALITPHAGHVYSGRIAGAAWAVAKSMKPRPETVILIGPSHFERLNRPSIWPRGVYECPLGPVEINAGLAGKLTKALGAGFRKSTHIREHCLGVQIPFIKQALPQASIVPVLTGRPDLERAQEMGRAIAGIIRDRPVLLAASTDLSHYHSLSAARRLDGVAARAVETIDAAGLMRAAAQGKAEACGLQAMLVVMSAARELGADRGVVLAQATSASVTGDTRRVVGYMAAALVKTNGVEPAGAGSQEPGPLGPDQRQIIKALARRSVEAQVLGLDPPRIPGDDPELMRPSGVFVTLKRGGRLRGCLGRIVADTPLAEAVARMARESACRDPRFRPVAPDELKEITVQVSLLTPMQPCRPQDVRVGVDGLLISLNGRSGLLLPQVPVELQWTREEYLQGLCRKAGLPEACWRDPGARLQRFQAQVF